MKCIKKRILALVLVLAVLSSGLFSANVFASDISDTSVIYDIQGIYDYSTKNSNARSSDDYYYIGKVSYRRIVYEYYRYYGDWYAIFGLDLSMPAYKGAYGMELTQTMSKTYMSQTAYEFSVSLGGNLGIEKVVELSCEITGSVSATTGREFSTEYAVSYTIPEDAPVGYYKIGVCHDIYRHYVVAKNSQLGTSMEYDMPSPRGTAYYALLYSTANDSGYAKQ